MWNNQSDRTAVVDIGSNSVRMVVFDRDVRSLEPVFNEKAMSGLGRDLLATGRLHDDGKASALDILARFRRIAANLGVCELRAVATAAARAANDGEAFVEKAAAALGQPVRVISGEEEARLSALGVICGIPTADGVIGDLGGGSLEVAEVSGGAVSTAMSLPLGSLTIGEHVGKRQEGQWVRDVLAEVPQGLARGRALYAVGGAWRALAKHYFERHRYPIRIIHEFELPAKTGQNFARSVGRVAPTDTDKLKGVSSRRRKTAPFSARLLDRLIERLEPERLVFSGYGLREGIEYENMAPETRERDPLLDHCRHLGLSGARMPFDGDRLAKWSLGAFTAPPADARLVRAAAWLSDMSGSDHPDYRGQHAAARTLHLSTAAIRHPERVFLAAAVYARYHGFGMESALGRSVELLDEPSRRRATALGMTLRLAHAIQPGDGAAGAPSLRENFILKRRDGRLFLLTDGIDPDILGETAHRRFASLARALDVEPAFGTFQSAAA